MTAFPREASPSPGGGTQGAAGPGQAVCDLLLTELLRKELLQSQGPHPDHVVTTEQAIKNWTDTESSCPHEFPEVPHTLKSKQSAPYSPSAPVWCSCALDMVVPVHWGATSA